MAWDELYNEPNDGQIIIRRNLLTLKFEFLVFIDISNIFKDKRQKALRLVEQLQKLNHPNLLAIEDNYQLLDSKKVQNGIILF